MEVDVIAESGAKTKGGVTVAPVTIMPVKVEYGARVSDAFVFGSDEVELDYLTAVADGFARGDVFSELGGKMIRQKSWLGLCQGYR